VNGEIHFLAESFQQGHVAAPLAAENEVCAHTQALDPAERGGQRPDEKLAGLAAERLIEVDQEQRISARGFEGAKFLGQRVDQRRDAFRRDHGAGMAVESYDQGQGVVLASVRNRLFDDLLMAEVDAVEKTDSEADRS